MRSTVDAIKERLDIAEVVSSYTKLEKAGTSFKARCPFHTEKTPSFLVSPLRQTFYCFGCGAKGDIFTFVEQMEGIEFKDALKLLAEKAGVEIVYERREGEKEDKEKLYGILESATAFFEEKLRENKVAYDYLVSRGLTRETIKEWRLGFAPDEWHSLLDHLKTLGYEKALCLTAGLVKTGDPSISSGQVNEREPYDVFRNRLIFPLRDASGRIIAFSGRVLDKDAMPKYLNSPDTPIFRKSEVLYGLDKSKMSIRKQNYGVLVEGQFDLLLSHQVGVKNTVASSGTAFTQSHLERLKHLSRRLILAFDGDVAGLAAAEKATFLGLTLGFELKVATLKEGEDPASLAQSSPEEWKKVLREAEPAPEFFLSKILAKEKDQRKIGKEIVAKILPMIKLLGSSIEQAHFISSLHARTGIKEEVLWADLKKVTSPAVVRGEENSLTLPPQKIEGRSRFDEYKEVIEFLKENPSDKNLLAQKDELEKRIRENELSEKIEALRIESRMSPDEVLKEIDILTRERDEVRRKLL